MKYIIEVQDVTKRFYEEILFEKISFNVEKGDIVGFVGKNGCGKSVLFKMICGLISVDEGCIKVLGRNITDGKFPSSTGIMLDGTGFIPYYSGYENLKNIAVIDNKVGEKEICECMELVGLDSKSRKLVKKYSLGMKQRLGIAMAIMENPDILLLDEPMNALDKNMVEQVRKLFQRLNREKGVTILMTSHNEKDIETLCHHVYDVTGEDVVLR